MINRWLKNTHGEKKRLVFTYCWWRFILLVCQRKLDKVMFSLSWLLIWILEDLFVVVTTIAYRNAAASRLVAAPRAPASMMSHFCLLETACIVFYVYLQFTGFICLFLQATWKAICQVKTNVVILFGSVKLLTSGLKEWGIPSLGAVISLIFVADLKVTGPTGPFATFSAWSVEVFHTRFSLLHKTAKYMTAAPAGY